MNTSLFPDDPSLARKARATARVLRQTAHTVPTAPASELRYIWSILRDPGYLWRVAEAAYQEREFPASRLVLRHAAFFWAAGMRPAAREMSPHAAVLLDEIAFLVVAHRLLLACELHTDEHRHDLFFHRERQIRWFLEDHPSPMIGQITADRLSSLREADVTVYCAREEGSASGIPRLIDYLDEFCLLPEDLGLTSLQLTQWRHQQLVHQAQMKFGACRPLGEEYGQPDYNVVMVHANIYGALLALTNGVSLDEAGINLTEILEVKALLDTWIPDALRRPDYYGDTRQNVEAFRDKTMPLIDQVVDTALGERRLVAVK